MRYEKLIPTSLLLLLVFGAHAQSIPAERNLPAIQRKDPNSSVNTPMTLKLSDLIKDKSKINLQEICTDWQWLIKGQKSVLLVTVFGDLFLIGPSDEINWLDSGTGKLTQVAASVNQFQEYLKDKDTFSNWFMTGLYLELRNQQVLLKENEVYSYKKVPALGGEYTPDNIEPTDISVHFSFTGQIHEQLKNLPTGTKVQNINIKP